MNDYIFTDLAYEDCEREPLEGLRTHQYRSGTRKELSVWEVHIENQIQAMRYRRPQGSYLTVLCDPIWNLDGESFDSLRDVLTSLLYRLLSPLLPTKKEYYTLLIVGLGNASFAVDAVGPQTAEKLNATRHMISLESKDTRLFRIAVVTPGVLAQTGIEAVEQIRGVVDVIDADAVIAVDALAASHYERLGATVQLSDSGICPGSGVGNARKAINKETVGIPVLSIGVPTVVDSATLICDALKRGGMERLSPQMESSVAKSRGYFVCPKESDLITQSVSFLLADAIDRLGGIKKQ